MVPRSYCRETLIWNPRCKNCIAILDGLGEEQCPLCKADLSEVGIWNETSVRDFLRPGRVFLTFSGDYDNPYGFAKVIALPENDLWVKMWRQWFADRPTAFDPRSFNCPHKILEISKEMFLAWGPPKFPILIAEEAVTEEELSEPRI
jgi:hypothetical protein